MTTKEQREKPEYTFGMRTFSARETRWQIELDGAELAGFGRRALAFVIDWVLVGLIYLVLVVLIGSAVLGARAFRAGTWHAAVSYKQHGSGLEIRNPAESNKTLAEVVEVLTDLIVPVLYFGVLLWAGKGRTPGKRLMRIRVVSIVHAHLTFWHSVERALGYGAAALEGGFGFLQFFIHPYRRCAQDRLAETIVITESGYKTLLEKRAADAVRGVGMGEDADSLRE